jgi:hypothetical protein
MHLLVAGKAHHRSGTFHCRHIGVSKGKLHIYTTTGFGQKPDLFFGAYFMAL